MVKAGSVVVAPGLPGGFGSAQVGLDHLGPGVDHLVLQLGSLRGEGLDLGLVDDILGQALASQRAGRLVLLRAVALPLLGHLPLADDLRVVARYQAPQIGHRPITHFHFLPVQHLVTGVAGWKAPVQDLEELLPDVGLDGAAEWRIEPVDVLLPISSSSSGGRGANKGG